MNSNSANTKRSLIFTKRAVLIALLISFLLYQGISQALWEVKFKKGQLISQGSYQIGIKTPQYSKEVSIEDWLKRLNKSVQTEEHVVLFFHAMWGSNQQFFNKNLRYFEKEILSTSVTRVIFIRWKAPSIGYLKNVEKSFEYGRTMAPSINEIIMQLEKKNCRITVMAHSMGNRIAKGWLDSSKPELSRIILFAPDLSNAEFQASGFYSKYTKNLLLFYNANDRFLKWSSQLNKCARLGRSPENDLLNTESHIQLINRSQMNDETKLGGSFSGHIYYMNSPSAIKIIRDLLY